MDNMPTDLRQAGRIPKETLEYLNSKKTLKTEREQKLWWINAGIFFVVTECLAFAIFFFPHRWSHFQFRPIALIILPLLAAPWVLGRSALSKYKFVAESTIQANVRADFSYQLAKLTFFAYALFMAGIFTALKWG